MRGKGLARITFFGNNVNPVVSTYVDDESDEVRVMKWSAVAATLIVTFLASVSFAQDGPAPEVGVGEGGEDGVVYESETNYDFEDDYVDGQLVRPDGEFIGARRSGKDSSLIRIRSDFIPEMVESVEQL